MMTTFTQKVPQPTEAEGDELLPITQHALRRQLLRARLIDDISATCVIQQGEQVYLSLRGVADEAQRQELTWAVLRLQMGAKLNPRELPDPLRSALLASAAGPSPLIWSLIWGSLTGVVGGVLAMALAGLIIMVLNVPTESFVGFMATAVTFVLSGTAIGCGTTIYFWRCFTRQTADKK